MECEEEIHRKQPAQAKTLFAEPEGLLLARKRVLQHLNVAQNPNHRQILQNALAYLDALHCVLPLCTGNQDAQMTAGAGG